MNNYVRQLFGVMFQSKQTHRLVRIQPQPAPTSPEEWRKHWQAKGFPWRTEPEIDAKRQEELAKCRAIVPNIENGIYPFKGMKLSRADVEWLLATHENGRGPVDWIDEHEHERRGLDLRAAALWNVNLSLLPLARLQGGLAWYEYSEHATDEHYHMAAIHLENANLFGAHLEGVRLNSARLEGADLRHAHFERAALENVHLENANLEGVFLTEADLSGAHLAGTDLRRARWAGSHLINAVLSDEHYIGPQLVDTHWGDVNLAVADWSQVKMLKDEYDARQKKYRRKIKDRETRLIAHKDAVRANRQLSLALQNQGLNEDAAHFAYRAQILQRKVLWMQRKAGRWLFSLVLALLAGYGYRMWRILAAYLIIVALCAVAYFVIGMHYAPHLTLLQAFLESITAFHGRVFYELFMPDTPQIWVTAFEAIAGLVIEAVFIAMLTQKFFGK